MATKQILNIAKQAHCLREDFPSFDIKMEMSKLIVIGSIQPTPLSNIYKFKLKYLLNKQPEIEILKPKLKKNFANEKIPHVYSDNKLCLYFPPANEWNPTRYISKYIIPWISEWLFNYEVWHSTGNWHGGGIHLNKK